MNKSLTPVNGYILFARLKKKNLNTRHHKYSGRLINMEMITSSYPLPQKIHWMKSCNNSNTWTYSYSKETSSIYRKTNSISRNTQDREVLIIFPRNSIFYYTDDPPANVIIYMCKINVEKSVRWPKWWSGKTRQKQLYSLKILGETKENLWNTVAN